MTTSPKGDRLHWSAISYHVGAHIFIINTLLAWLPYAYPRTELPGMTKYGVGLTTLPANIFFLVGAYLELADTINKLYPSQNLNKCEMDYGSTQDTTDVAEDKRCATLAANIDLEACVQPQEAMAHPSDRHRTPYSYCCHALHSRSVHDTPINACIIQLVGAMVYITTGVADLPGVSSYLTPSQKVVLNIHDLRYKC